MDNEAKRMSRLARGLRDQGVPPDRDLLPEIEAAIDREEDRRRVRSGRTAVPWPRLVAVAAALTVVLVAAWTGVHRDEAGLDTLDGPRLAALDTGPAEAETDEMGLIDRALDELNAALDADPENQGLSRLVLMVHKKRGDLLRRTSGSDLLN